MVSLGYGFLGSLSWPSPFISFFEFFSPLVCGRITRDRPAFYGDAYRGGPIIRGGHYGKAFF